jgi:cyclopropane fatty-acyl-phospholipid synthase-like methyltransferase
MKEAYTYYPEAWHPTNIEAAKEIILTKEVDCTTAERWVKETPYLIDLMKPLGLHENSMVLDFGVGIGRLAKEIIKKYNCQVIGMDISNNMRALSLDYVSSDKYFAIPLTANKLFPKKFDAIICVWVLQHVLFPETDIAHLNDMLADNGKVFVVNAVTERIIPTTVGWRGDDKDVWKILETNFNLLNTGWLDPSKVGHRTSIGARWSIYEKKK